MGTTTGRAIDAAEQTVAGLRRKVETVMDEQVTPALAGAADAVQAKAEDVYGRAKAEADTLAAHVRNRPLTSVALAAVAGFVAARIIGR
ncbi:hypothetical protein C8P66_11043 [Humitalea rosea]|uniref:ElaB/YqjD/DUF883 family membrane-anchored ribosome-binding protein n=1 Tax=Humitalea rosea TaxID=990373 RepID=A0A2W7IKN2_9PROT|nr:hypothetical protein [Humitalea rosea]PZW45845.1 hypothetical protein C8P66_11043 [Humitalea rosea]